MLESMESFRAIHCHTFRAAEWLFTVLFSIEYLLRVVSIGDSLRYIVSPRGVVDFVALLPTYLEMFIPQDSTCGSCGLSTTVATRAFRVIRECRFLRVLVGSEPGLARQSLNSIPSYVLGHARLLKAWVGNVIMFLVAGSLSLAVFGIMMYIVEGDAHGFTSIPTSIYYGMAEIGSGDLRPYDTLSLFGILFLGCGVLALTVGLVHNGANGKLCTMCLLNCHDGDAKFCKKCGCRLHQWDHVQAVPAHRPIQY